MWQNQAELCLHDYEKLLQLHDYFQVHSIHVWRILWWTWTETQIRAQPFQKQCSNSNNNDDMFKSRLLRSCGGFYHMLWTALLYFLKENHSNRCCGANQVNHVWSKAGRSTGTVCSAIPEHNPSKVHLFRSYSFVVTKCIEFLTLAQELRSSPLHWIYAVGWWEFEQAIVFQSLFIIWSQLKHPKCSLKSLKLAMKNENVLQAR